MARVVLAGGSGFLGRALAEDFLRSGWEVVSLGRRPRGNAGGVREVAWDGRTLSDWSRHLRGAHAVVNLVGRSVDCRHNARNRAEIVNSRVDSVRAIGAGIRAASPPLPVWVQASSLAIYGDAGDRVCDEEAPHGVGFSADVCEQWERAIAGERAPATRKVILRIGFTLGRGGGALETLVRLARLGLGGTVGSGRQWISWLHIEDLIRLTRWTVENGSASGIYNATGPTPVRNRDFMRALRKALGVRFGPPAPAPAVRLGAFLMRTEASLALTGRRCLPARLTAEGFQFRHPDLGDTLAQLLSRRKAA